MIRKIVIGLVVVVACFGATLWGLNTFWPAATGPKPKLAELPPLKEASRPSVVVAPVAVSLGAIRTALDASAPRNFAGKNDNPLSQLIGKATIDFTVSRGALALAGRPDALTITTPLTGNVHIAGQLGSQAGKAVGQIGNALGNLLGGSIGKQVENFAGKPFDQNTALRGNITATARPTLTPGWRIEPNIAAQVNLDSSINIAGARINLSNEVKQVVDPLVNSEVTKLEARLRGDPTLENAVKKQWAQMCRSIAFGGDKTGLPKLWLELKPVRAIAAQPRIDANAVTLNIGVEANTRVVATETKPNCPFPSQLVIAPAADQGKLAIGLPIDVPFTEVNKLLEAQLKGRKFPDDKSAPVEVEVRKASVAASGDRLLISLLAKAVERKSWFGFGAEATVHIWGKPVLDQKQQILRLTDLSLAVESEAAFGLLGAAARAAMPYLQDALAQNAVVDLKPFAKDAKDKIAAALVEFRQVTPGLRVDSTIDDVRLVGIDFDSKTLRVITEAQGAVRVSVSQLPKI